MTHPSSWPKGSICSLTLRLFTHYVLMARDGLLQFLHLVQSAYQITFSTNPSFWNLTLCLQFHTYMLCTGRPALTFCNFKGNWLGDLWHRMWSDVSICFGYTHIGSLTSYHLLVSFEVSYWSRFSNGYSMFKVKVHLVMLK